MSAPNQMMDLMKASMMMNSKDNPIYAFLMLTILEFMIKYITQAIEYGKKYLDTYFQTKFKKAAEHFPMTNNLMKDPYDIIFERKYGNKKTEEYVRVDSILAKLAQMPHIKKMIYAKSTYMVNYTEIIPLGDPLASETSNDNVIKFQLIEIAFDAEMDVQGIKFRLFTEHGNAETLKKFVENCEIEYEIKKKNRLGEDCYFFDHLLQPKDQMGNDPCPDKVVYQRNLFLTNRTLDNVFFEAKDEVQTRLEMFINRKDWYDRRGIPHNLAMLLHGPPGAGKTSLIKAVANLTKRHILNVNLAKITTKAQLKQLFYDERIWVMEKKDVGENMESYIIPRNKRLYVIEDIDCLDGDLLKRKKLDEEDETSSNSSNSNSNSNSEQKKKQKPTTSTSAQATLGSLIGGYNNRSRQPLLPSGGQLRGTSAQMGYQLGTNLNEEQYSMTGNLTPAQMLIAEQGLNLMTEGMGNTSMPQADPFQRITPGFNTGQQYNSNTNTNTNNPTNPNEKKEDDSGKIDLSAILNVLDGTLETPGRMLIITSNYPEKLDEALVRPGRIDMIIEFKKANRQLVSDMYECFYEEKPNKDILNQIDDYKWSPAEVSQIMFKNCRNPKQSLQDLVDNDPATYFQFSYFESEAERKKKEDLKKVLKQREREEKNQNNQNNRTSQTQSIKSKSKLTPTSTSTSTSTTSLTIREEPQNEQEPEPEGEQKPKTHQPILTNILSSPQKTTELPMSIHKYPIEVYKKLFLLDHKIYHIALNTVGSTISSPENMNDTVKDLIIRGDLVIHDFIPSEEGMLIKFHYNHECPPLNKYHFSSVIGNKLKPYTSIPDPNPNMLTYLIQNKYFNKLELELLIQDYGQQRDEIETEFGKRHLYPFYKLHEEKKADTPKDISEESDPATEMENNNDDNKEHANVELL